MYFHVIKNVPTVNSTVVTMKFSAEWPADNDDRCLPRSSTVDKNADNFTFRKTSNKQK
jgi:hypothetical protein